jgi:glyoxylase-like metal-dependent hydrolase (beta-lactamase superfamily II)
MPAIHYSKGLHELGNGQYAYLQPSGTWGFSNAGLIVDGEESLLVDTLFDERLTGEMLDVMRDATGLGASDITTLVNTHANGDHTFGNRLVTKAMIIASAASASEMSHEGSPEFLAAMMAKTGLMGQTGKYLDAIFGRFRFAGIELRLPDRTFVGEETLMVGDKKVHLIEVGPAHTAGDTVVYVPDDKVVYTGDILFVEGTPIMWKGPVRNWIAACDRLLAMDVDLFVPGHGAVTDRTGVLAVRSYLSYVGDAAAKRHRAGMNAWEAAQDIALAEFGAWEDPERIAVTVDTIYRELNQDNSPRDLHALFNQMAILDLRYNPERTVHAPPEHLA